jgi:hypothetical protein
VRPGQIRVDAGARRGHRTSDIVLTSSRLDGVPENLLNGPGRRNPRGDPGPQGVLLLLRRWGLAEGVEWQFAPPPGLVPIPQITLILLGHGLNVLVAPDMALAAGPARPAPAPGPACPPLRPPTRRRPPTHREPLSRMSAVSGRRG